jgi:SAM-dependent methyltransferase
MAVDWKRRAVVGRPVRAGGQRRPRAHVSEAALRPTYGRATRDYDAAAGLEVLDVGCGQGIDVCEVALAGAMVAGIDLTPRLVQLRRRRTRLRWGAPRRSWRVTPRRCLSRTRASIVSSPTGPPPHSEHRAGAPRDAASTSTWRKRATVIVCNRNSWHYWLNHVLWRGLLHGLLVRGRGMTGVLSTGVERSSIGARPLVGVFSQRQVESMLVRARFECASTWVSPFRASDSPFTRRLPESLPLGGGWYVVGHAFAPRAAAK